MSMVMSSSISAETKTDAKEVWRRLPASKGDLRTSRCNAGLGTQPAVGEVAAELDRRALDAGHLARRDLDQIGAETPLLAPAQVHAQQHLGPVLGFGAAGSGLDVEEGVGFVLLALEHAPELQLAEVAVDAGEFVVDVVQGFGIALGDGEIGQIGEIAQGATDVVEPVDDRLQRRLLPPQGLGPAGFVPEIGVRQLPLDLL